MGLTSYVATAHLARAVLEATDPQTAEVVEAMAADPGLASTRLPGGRRDDGQLGQASVL